MYPTFFFKETMNGIITSTFPVVKQLEYDDDAEPYVLHYDFAVNGNYWYPKVEFIFTSVNKTEKLGFKAGQLLPFGVNSNKRELDFCPTIELGGAPIFWGGLIEGDVFEILNLTRDFMYRELGDYYIWRNDYGKEALEKLYEWYYSELKYSASLRNSNVGEDNCRNNIYDDYDQYNDWSQLH